MGGIQELCLGTCCRYGKLPIPAYRNISGCPGYSFHPVPYASISNDYCRSSPSQGGGVSILFYGRRTHVRRYYSDGSLHRVGRPLNLYQTNLEPALVPCLAFSLLPLPCVLLRGGILTDGSTACRPREARTASSRPPPTGDNSTQGFMGKGRGGLTSA